MAGFNDRILVVIDAASSGAVQELKELESSAKGADTATVNLGKSLKTGLVAGAAALAGTGLLSFLSDSVQKFQEAQESAAQFARATNATVVEAGKFTTVARTLGLDMNDLIEINAEFSKKIEEQPQLLEQLNVQVAKNADGSVNMTRTLVSTIDALGSMKDGLKAAQTAAELFGEEGSKQLAGFYLQGIEVADLMDRIDFVDQSDRAKRFAASTIEMNLAMEQLQVTLGAEIVPLMTGLADAASDVILFMSQIPTEVYLAVGGFVALRQVFRTLGTQRIVDGLLNITAAAASPIQATKTLATNIGNIARANAGNIAFAGLLIGYTTYQIASENARKRTEEFVLSLQDLESAGASAEEALRKTAEEMLDGASNTERFVTALNNSGTAFRENSGVVNRLADAFQALWDDESSVEDYENALAKVREEMGEYAVVVADAAKKQEDPNTVVAEYVTKGGEIEDAQGRIAEAAAAAAEAQTQQEQVTRLAAEALAIAAGDAGYFLQRLKDLENFGGSSVEALKQDLEGIDFKDVADTWANEALIASERAYDTIVGGLVAAVEQNPQLDLSAWLDQFRGFSPELDAVINQVLADATADTQLQTTLEVAKGESVDSTKAELDEFGNPITGTFTLTEQGVAEAAAAKEGLAAPIETTLTVNTSFAPGGYEGVKARKDYLREAVESTIAIDTSFDPGGYTAVKARKDFLTKAATSSIAINVSFGPGGYSAVKARKDYLTQNRTSYIDVVVRGASAAAAQLGGLRSRSAVDAQRSSFGTPVVNNRLNVSLDGQQLRGIIREEVRFAAPRAVEVA